MKYDKMVEITQAESQRKMEIARKAIEEMLSNMERVTVAGLVRKTGLSRGFFYKNPLISDKAMNNTLMILKSEIRKVKAQNKELQLNNQELCEQNECLNKEVENLKKQLGRKEIGLLKKL